MGYKLAGYNHLGGVEIDKRVADVYNVNHDPKYLFVEDIRLFVKRNDLPAELYNLDILDGSPPCSSFSMAGNREKDWGKEKVFSEGQALQTLDDLFFDYINLSEKLQPKVIIAENVKGLIQGNAKSYVRKIKAGFESAGYKVQLFLLNAASMGVPQKRERVFFICQRKDLNLPELKMHFNEPLIPFSAVRNAENTKDQTPGLVCTELWHQVKPGQQFSKARADGNFFGNKKLSATCVMSTIIANTHNGDWDYERPRILSIKELTLGGTYPLDYDFGSIHPKYLIGMSVPPVMTAQIANQVYLQWFKQ